MFKECLKHNIVPFIIYDDLKLYYYRGLQYWHKEQEYLKDTCLLAQDRFKKYLDYFNVNTKVIPQYNDIFSRKAAEGNAVWQVDLSDKFMFHAPVIATCPDGDINNIKFTFMQNLNAAIAWQSAHEQDFKNNIWLTDGMAQMLNLGHQKGKHGIVITTLDRETKEPTTMYLYNANSLFGLDGQRVLRSQYEKKVPQTEIVKKDRIMYTFMDEMAKAIPQEKAAAGCAKPAKERINLYALAKQCYERAVKLVENDVSKGTVQHSQHKEKTVEQETSSRTR